MSDSNSPTSPPSASLQSILGPGFLENPYPTYDVLRSRGGVEFVPGAFHLGAWFISRHSFCSTILRGKTFGKEAKKALSKEALSQLPPSRLAMMEREPNSFLHRDPPVHTRLRGLVSQAFTPRTVELMRSNIISITERLIHNMQEAGSGDLMVDFALPLPFLVITELLGIPHGDRSLFRAWTTAIVPNLSPSATAEELAKVNVALDEMNVYLENLANERRRAPREDLITGLVQAHDDTDRLSTIELITTCRLLLLAGHETTMNLIGNSMLALLTHPAHRAELVENPALMPNAIEELLRFDGPVQIIPRFIYEDMTLGGQTIRRGEQVALCIGAANRDPAQFSNPNSLDFRRANASTHLALGQGIHYCLGAPLARMEAEEAISALLKHLPEMKLASQSPQYTKSVALRSLSSLPVSYR